MQISHTACCEESRLARAKTRQYVTQADEVRRWREGLGDALHAPKRKRRRPLKFVAGGLVLLIIALGVGGFMYWRVIGGLFTRTDVNLRPASGKALNVLLVGSDSREGLSDPLDVERFGSVGGKRADTIILAQLVPREQRGVLLSFPRDLYVTVRTGEREFQSKINAAYGYGPQSIVDTVSGLTGVPINHYMEVDIRGFRSMVDAIGGIDVTLDQSLYDSKLNFRLPAGKTHMDGNQALSFVRARHATPDGDFGRIKRQQQFLRSVITKVGAPASYLRHPTRVNSLARAFARNVTVDQFFQFDDLIKIGLGVRRTPSLETFSVPGHSASAGGQSIVAIDQAPAQQLFQALRNADDPAKLGLGSQASAP